MNRKPFFVEGITAVEGIDCSGCKACRSYMNTIFLFFQVKYRPLIMHCASMCLRLLINSGRNSVFPCEGNTHLVNFNNNITVLIFMEDSLWLP